MNRRKFLWLILTHQPANAVMKMVESWQEHTKGEVFVLYGGPDAEYEKIQLTGKCLVRNDDLLTRDHPRERQSYAYVFRKALERVDLSDFDYVYFTEFDQIPVSKELDEKLGAEMESSGADLLCYGLKRIDKTNHPHWLNHKSQEEFRALLSRIGVRHDEQLILSCYGFGQCWTARAFAAVAGVGQEFPVYLEIWIPTLAYHLGYKVSGMSRDEDLNIPLGEFEMSQIEKSGSQPWFVHPIKSFWVNSETVSVH